MRDSIAFWRTIHRPLVAALRLRERVERRWLRLPPHPFFKTKNAVSWTLRLAGASIGFLGCLLWKLELRLFKSKNKVSWTRGRTDYTVRQIIRCERNLWNV